MLEGQLFGEQDAHTDHSYEDVLGSVCRVLEFEFCTVTWPIEQFVIIN